MSNSKDKIPSTYYVNNFKISQSRRVCEFLFTDFLKDVRINTKDRIFEIEISEKLMIKKIDALQSQLNQIKEYRQSFIKICNHKSLIKSTDNLISEIGKSIDILKNLPIGESFIDVDVNDYVDIPFFKKFWGANWKLIYSVNKDA